MASRRIKADRLAEEIQKILDDYGGEIEDNVTEITKKMGQKGATALRNESKDTFGTNKKDPYKYAKGWTASEVTHQHYISTVIHNKKVPGLPHLLEHGHALRVGGRSMGNVPGRPHISVVEDSLIEEYQREIISKL